MKPAPRFLNTRFLNTRFLASLFLASFFLMILILLSGCPGPLSQNAGGITTTEPRATDQREWRLIFVFLDANDLAEVAQSDIDAIAQFPDRSGRTHRLIVRDRTYDGTSLAIAGGGTTRRVELAGLAAGSLLRKKTLESVLTVAEREFPAPRQALFLIGHGRGWQGIGYNENSPADHLTAESLRRAALSSDSEYSLLVLDAGWSGFAELLLEVAETPVEIVAAGTNLIRAGIDYGTLLETLDTGPWSPADVREKSGAALTRAGGGIPAVELPREELYQLGPYLQELSQAATALIPSEPARERLKSSLMENATAAALPGDAHITVGSIAEELAREGALTRRPALDRVLIHLVSVDELGLPAGHAVTYRTATDLSGLPRFFRDISWAPDFFGRSGFLFDLWYREY